MKAIPDENYARTYQTSEEKSKLFLYHADGSVHYFRPEPSATPGSRSSSGLPIREIDFEQLPDGRLAEIVEDPDDPTRSLLAFGRDDSYQLVESIQCDEEILVPIPRNDELLRHIPLPRGVEEVRGRAGVASPEILKALIANFIRERVVVDPMQLFIMTSFIDSTWYVDRLEVAPYLQIVGPPQSGKRRF